MFSISFTNDITHCDYFRYLRQNSASSDGSNRPDGQAGLDTSIPGQLMARYLLAMLGGGRGASPFFGPLGMMDPEGGGGSSGSGRWGDYVFTQDGPYGYFERAK